MIEERTPREAPTAVEFAMAAAFCVPYLIISREIIRAVPGTTDDAVEVSR